MAVMHRARLVCWMILVSCPATSAWAVSPRAESAAKEGWRLREEGRYAESLKHFDRALDEDVHYAYAWQGKGASLANLGYYKEAVTMYDQALSIAPQNTWTLIERGNALRALRRWPEADRSYDRALAIDPKAAYAWNGKGTVRADQQDQTGALSAYDRALAINPDNAIVLRNRALALRALRRLDEALAAVDRSLDIAPRDSATLTTRGNVLSALGRAEEGLAAYEMALDIAPNSAVAWRSKGLNLRRLKQDELALVAYDRALQLEPKSARGHCGRANVLLSLGRYEEARLAFTKALEIAPGDASANDGKGNALAWLKRFAEAKLFYDRARELDPLVGQSHDWYLRGVDLQRRGELAAAREAYQQAADNDYEDAWRALLPLLRSGGGPVAQWMRSARNADLTYCVGPVRPVANEAACQVIFRNAGSPMLRVVWHSAAGQRITHVPGKGSAGLGVTFAVGIPVGFGIDTVEIPRGLVDVSMAARRASSAALVDAVQRGRLSAWQLRRLWELVATGTLETRSQSARHDTDGNLTRAPRPSIRPATADLLRQLAPHFAALDRDVWGRELGREAVWQADVMLQNVQAADPVDEGVILTITAWDTAKGQGQARVYDEYEPDDDPRPMPFALYDGSGRRLDQPFTWLRPLDGEAARLLADE